jgi:amicyanin
MNKPAAGIVTAVIAIGVVGGVVYTNEKDSGKKRQDDTSMNANDMRSMEPEKRPDDSAKPIINEVQSGTASMNIQDFDFQTEKLKVKVGTKVTWTNKDDARHDVAPDTDSPDFVGSKLLAKGESYSFTFEKPGTYTYHCSPHPYMKASVEVVE